MVRTPLVTMTSLTANGTPARGPGSSPAANFRSTFCAAASARSAEKCRYALVFGFSFSANSSEERASSTALKVALGEAFLNLRDGEGGQARHGRAHRSITFGTL